MNSWIYTFSIFISYFVFELYKSRSCIFIRVINSELIKISHSKVKKKTSVWLKEQQSGSGSLGRKLKLLASTLSRVLCYYESNSTIVVARSTRGDTYVGGRGEDAGRLRALVCNARVHWNQRDGGVVMEFGERAYTLGRYRAVVALTVKGIRYGGAREKTRERRRTRIRDSDEFKILETLAEGYY